MSLLEDARVNINNIDKKMAELFEQRMKAVDQVLHYKIEHGLEVLDATREEAMLETYPSYIINNVYKDSYKRWLKATLAISKDYQTSNINQGVIGYQGVQGAFSHIASEHLFPHHKKKILTTFEDVFKAVINNDISYGVVPFENSYTGEVGEVLDLLTRYKVYIQQIYDLRISQNLLGVKGATLQDIKQVYSKDQAIYQSKKFLEGRDYEIIPFSNTALAAEYVAKEHDISKAAIAAKENAELYDLDILASDINTSEQNTTRFIVISKQLKLKGNRFSMMFTAKHETGALLKAMEVIADFGFNMDSIKSRSIKDQPWEYYFYIEIEGSLQQTIAQALIRRMEENCDKVRILGAYEKESRD